MSVEKSDIKRQRDELKHMRGECEADCVVCKQEREADEPDPKR